MADLELHGKTYPGALVRRWAPGQGYPKDVDSVVIEAGQDRFVASARSIDFRGVRFGDPVRAGNVRGELAMFVDRADTFGQKLERFGENLAQVPEWIGLQLMVARAKVMSFFMGLASGG